MKKYFSCLLITISLFMISSCALFPTDAIEKLVFWHWWESGEPNSVVLGSTESDYTFENAWFDIAVHSKEELSTLNIKLTGTDGKKKLSQTKNIDFNDYEVQRRRYKKFGYYVLNVDLEKYIGMQFDLTIEMNGTTKSGRPYSFTYSAPANIKNY